MIISGLRICLFYESEVVGKINLMQSISTGFVVEKQHIYIRDKHGVNFIKPDVLLHGDSTPLFKCVGSDQT